MVWRLLFQEAALLVYRFAHHHDPARGRVTTWATVVFRTAAGRVVDRLARQPRTARLVSPKSDDSPDSRSYLADPRPGPAALAAQREAVDAVRATGTTPEGRGRPGGDGRRSGPPPSDGENTAPPPCGGCTSRGRTARYAR